MKAIDKQIQEAQSQGNRAAEAILRGQKAAQHSLQQNWSRAAQELEQAAALAAAVKQTAVQAQILLALGKVLQHLPDKGAETVEALQQAASYFQQAEKESQAIDALQELARAHLSVAEYDTALQVVDQALTLAKTKEDGLLLVSLHQLQAGIGLQQLDWDLVEFSLEMALSAAHTFGQPDLMVTVEQQLNILQSWRRGQATPAGLSNLQPLWSANEQVEPSNTTKLAMASNQLLQGLFDQAATTAEEVIKAARISTDVSRFQHYLQASLIQAGAAENKGDHAAVLAALLRCRTFLNHHLGDQFGKAIDLILNGLTESWGQETMQQAIKAYQEKIERDGKIEA